MTPEMFRERVTAQSQITQVYKATSNAARSSASKMSTLIAKMVREQVKLDKTRTSELGLAQQENTLLRQRLTWYGAPRIPKRRQREKTLSQMSVRKMKRVN